MTLRDVASRAGVSPIVVSRVLHNKALSIRVAEATAERVRKAAQDLGYVKNVAAVNFRTRQTLTIGILHGLGFDMPTAVGGSRYSEFMLEGIIGGSFRILLNGIIIGAFHHGYSIILCPKLLGQTAEEAMSDGRCDGLVLYNTDHTEANAEILRKCTVPIVLVHSRASYFDCKLPSVICDNHQGIGLAVEHLAKLGHRRVGFVKEARPLNAEMSEREDAFFAQAHAFGLNVDRSDSIDRQDFDTIFSRRYTAVITSHDGVAGFLIPAAEARGIRIPEDLSIVGFDSTSYCNELRPTLTSVRQPLQVLGEHAVDLLVQSIRGELTDPPQLTFPCGFDVRESTSPPAH